MKNCNQESMNPLPQHSKWATESTFLINFWVPAKGLCVHCAFPETSERNGKFGSWPGFCRHHSKISILKRERTVWGVFEKGLCSQILSQDIYHHRDRPKQCLCYLVFFTAFASQANDGGRSGYYHNGLFTLKSQREETKESKRERFIRNKIILPQVNHKRGEQGQKSSVLSYEQIKPKITSKVKSRANDLYRHNSSISMKDYST